MPSPRPELSPRQHQVLQHIIGFVQNQGLPPTRGELAAALGLRNRQGIEQHLRALERKGYLQLSARLSRGIRLLGLDGEPADPPPRTLRAERLALYGRVAAGLPTLALENIEDEITLDATLFRPRADFLLRVHGQSMRDAGILDRDILAVHRTPTASNGQIVVARLGEEATVKYYRRNAQLIRLEPANPAFQPLQIDLRQSSCVIEGLVVGIVRSGMPQRR